MFVGACFLLPSKNNIYLCRNASCVRDQWRRASYEPMNVFKLNYLAQERVYVN